MDATRLNSETVVELLSPRALVAAPLDMHLTTAQAWESMMSACEQATHTIDFEQYIVKKDAIGLGFLNLLARRAREGVRVRIVLDALGSRDLLGHEIGHTLARAGAQLVFYHERRTGHWLRPLSWLPRTHVKALHVDGVTWLGSMCMADYMRTWRDTMVRLDGDTAQAAQRDFEHVWSDLGDGRLDGDGEPQGEGLVPLRYAAQNPKAGRYPLYDSLVDAIQAAQHDICLATPYFFPPKRLRRALESATKRGVRVRLMLSHATDVPMADCVTTALLPLWRRRGYEVQLYQDTVLHAKYAVIDDAWATVGSCNFDFLSLCCNREANLVGRDGAVVAQVRRQFEQDLLACRLPTRADERRGSWPGWMKGRLGALLLHRI